MAALTDIPLVLLRSGATIALLVATLSGCGGPDAVGVQMPGSPAHADDHVVASVAPRTQDVRQALRATLTDASHALLSAATPNERQDVRALYDAHDHMPLWLDAAARPHMQARAALALLAAAGDDGLQPDAYGWPALSEQASTLQNGAAGPEAISELAAFDVALSAGMLRYLRHLHLGRVDPRTIGLQIVVPSEPHDFVAVLREALHEGHVADLHARMSPPLMQYHALREALPRYRDLAARTDLADVPAPYASVKPGEAYQGSAALHARLVALGDLPEDTPPPTGRSESGALLYDDVLAEGVRRFQRRHGLNADGVVGKASVAALNVALTWRVRQIELALERMRWLPDLDDRRLIGLNIPMFQFWAWDAAPGKPPAFGMRAIVGRALSTQTPVFTAELQQVVFRPYWNVPRSILRNELLPAIERDTSYLRRHDMEMVAGWGDAAPVVSPTPENMARLRRGELRLRQRPGPRNALGLVKFDFPNSSDVYMHGTPAQELFSRARRDFSHGCVRVEDPLAFAEWVLRDQAGWTRAEIEAAATGTRTRYVRVEPAVRVVLFYTTAAVMPADGTMHFAEDIYRHDARLDAALGR